MVNLPRIQKEKFYQGAGAREGLVLLEVKSLCYGDVGISPVEVLGLASADPLMSEVLVEGERSSDDLAVVGAEADLAVLYWRERFFDYDDETGILIYKAR